MLIMLNRLFVDIDAVLLAVSSRAQSANTKPQAHIPPVIRSISSTRSIPSSQKGYSLEPPSSMVPSRSSGGTPADETAILTRGPDIMALGEYNAAMDAVVGDLEGMWRGYKEGRGGAREAGIRDLVRSLFTLRCQCRYSLQLLVETKG